MITVRRLVAGDIDRVTAVLGLARLHQGDGFYLVAWEDEEPLGHLHLALTDPPEIQDVSVRREHRRRGVAKTLIEAAEAEGGQRGATRMRVTVSVDNDDAQALYGRAGYGDIGVAPVRVKGSIEIRTGLIDVDDTLLVWEKPLRPEPDASLR